MGRLGVDVSQPLAAAAPPHPCPPPRGGRGNSACRRRVPVDPPDCPDSRAPGLDPAAAQAARRHPRRADDRACLAARGRGRCRPGGRRRRRSPRSSRRFEAAGGRAILTRADHASGSDRIAEALARLDPDRRHDVVVNVQGDLPTIEPASRARRRRAARRRDVDIATLATPIRRAEERDDPNVVKAVGNAGRRAPLARALFHPRDGALGRGRVAAPHRPLRLSPRGAGAFRRAAALAAGAARAAGAIARAGGGDADRHRAGRRRAARRRHARGSGARARAAGAGLVEETHEHD